MPLQPSPSVVRAGEVLALLAADPHRAFSTSELARLTEVPRATCASLLLGLDEAGLVQRDERLGYRLGPACIALGDAARTGSPALRAASARAEALARALGAVTAVSMRDGHHTRVAGVFDHGPPFVLRPRSGDSIALVPPFGASFVAWDDDAGIGAWLGRATPALTDDEVERYLAALDAVRRRGYSVTVASDRQARLAEALEHLAADPDLADARSRRDRAMRDIAHSDYLAAELDPGATARLTQISAPVFDAGGAVAVSVMLLGPGHELDADEIASLGEKVRSAADEATADLGGRPPTGPR